MDFKYTLFDYSLHFTLALEREGLIELILRQKIIEGKKWSLPNWFQSFLLSLKFIKELWNQTVFYLCFVSVIWTTYSNYYWFVGGWHLCLSNVSFMEPRFMAWSLLYGYYGIVPVGGELGGECTFWQRCPKRSRACLALWWIGLWWTGTWSSSRARLRKEKHSMSRMFYCLIPRVLILLCLHYTE